MRFHFPAERILKLKQQQLKQAESVCQRLQADLQSCIDQLAELQQLLKQDCSMVDLINQQHFRNRVYDQIQSTRERQQELTQQLEQARAHCVECHQETESLLKYRANLLKEFRRTESNRELADRTDSMMHRRRRVP